MQGSPIRAYALEPTQNTVKTSLLVLAIIDCAMTREDRIRELCCLMTKAEGAELDAAIVELRSITRADTVTPFPAAMERRKRA